MYDDYVIKNKIVVEETEEQIYKLTSENMELYRKIRVGKEAEIQLKNNQKVLDKIIKKYLELRKFLY